MSLTLTVTSRHSQTLGPASVKVFHTEGGSIGRAAGNDWVLPDPSKFVSSRHATIEVIRGEYYLCDTSTNGTFVNGSADPVAFGSKLLLKHGDRIQIGEYELAVTLVADVMVEQPATHRREAPVFEQETSPFGSSAPPLFSRDPPAPIERPAAPSWPPPRQTPLPSSTRVEADRSWDPDPSPLGEAPVQDPLEAMSRGRTDRRSILDDEDAGYAPIPPAGQGAWQEADPLEDHLSVPPVLGPSTTQPGQIPSDWDKTTFPGRIPSLDQDALRPPQGSPQGMQPQRPVPERPVPERLVPERPVQERPVPTQDWDADPFPRGNVGRPQPPMPQGASQPPSQPQRSTAPTQRAPTPRPAAAPPPQSGYAPPAPGGYTAPAAGYTGAADPNLLRHILEMAGMDAAGAHAATANPQLADTLGFVLQIFVQGMMDVLRARSEVKEEFRLQHTRMRPVENNPLKFCPDGRAALTELFAKQGGGFLSPVDAVREAFDDTKAHQMAMMAGMQAAFENLMKRFNPEVLRVEFEKQSGGGVFQALTKAKYWDALVDLYARQMRNPDESFRRLFGEPFAEAYEQQMARLTGGRRRH